MSLYPNFETSTLIELLAQYTDRLTELFSQGAFGREYELCKKLIEELQNEVEIRNRSSSNQVHESKTVTKLNLIR